MVMKLRRAYSIVISSIILTSVVLAVGGGVWYFSRGASTVIADDYVEGITELIDELSERFIIEHVARNATHVRVWVYNYGEVPIVVDVYVDIEGGASGSSTDVEVASHEVIEVGIELAATTGDEVAVKASSRRGNNAYCRYIA